MAWGLLDQVVSSASNFVVLVLAARALTAADFGAFALAMAAVIFATAATRGVASDPLATAHSASEPEQQREAIRSGAAAVLWPALAVAGGVAALGLLLEGAPERLTLVVAAVVPGLVLQDFLRYALIVEGRARHTLANDLLWLLIQVPALLWAERLGGETAGMLAAWGAAGTLCALVGLAQAGVLPGPPASVVSWLRDHRSLWPYYLVDNLVRQVSAVGMLAAIGVVSGTATVGGVRAAMTVYAPLTVLSRGVVGVAVPELARREARGESVRAQTLRLAIGLAVIGLVGAVATLLIPDSVGRGLLGDSWRLAEPVLLLAGSVPVVGLFSSGIVVGIRAIGAARHGLMARLFTAALVMVAAGVGAWWDGIQGVFVLLAGTAPLQMITWYILLKTAHPPTPTERERQQ